MFKKIIISLLLLFMGLMIFSMVSHTDQALLNYSEKYFSSSKDILGIKKTDEGAYVFKNPSKDSNVVFFMEKKFFGWAYANDVHSGDLGPLIEQAGFSLTEFPQEDASSKAMFFGKVVDDEIKKITFNNHNTGESKDVSFIGGDHKIWFFFMDNPKKDEFIVKTYDSKDQVISEIEILTDRISYLYYKNIKDNLEMKSINR